MAITSFDKPTARVIGQRTVAALAALAAELGCEVESAGGSFDDGTFTCKVRYKLATVNGMDRDEAAFKRDCHLFYLEPEDYGAIINMPGGAARIVALAPGRSKRPIVIEYVARPGKRYVINADFVMKQRGRKYPWDKDTSTAAKAAR